MKLAANGPVDMSSANSGRLVSLPEANCIVSQAKNRLVSNGLKAPRLARFSKQSRSCFQLSPPRLWKSGVFSYHRKVRLYSSFCHVLYKSEDTCHKQTLKITANSQG